MELSEREYDNFLNEIYGIVTIGRLQYNTSHVLKNVDETAYHIGYNDWLDSMEEDENKE